MGLYWKKENKKKCPIFTLKIIEETSLCSCQMSCNFIIEICMFWCFSGFENYIITFSKTFQNLPVSICGTRNLFKHEWYKFNYNFSLYIIASFMKIDIPSLFLKASPYWYTPAHFLPSWVLISLIYAIIQKPFLMNCQIISNFLKGFSAKSVIILAKCVWRSTLWGRWKVFQNIDDWP